MELAGCRACNIVWFDKQSYELIPEWTVANSTGVSMQDIETESLRRLKELKEHEKAAAEEEKKRKSLARALKTVLLKYDGLWNRPFPYIMAIHQAPTDGGAYPEAHVRAEFFPAHRMRDRLKYLAGSEIGAGVFTADTDPDDKAAELKAVTVACD